MNLTKILNCMRSYLSDSAYRFNINKALGLYNHMPDEAFLKKAFYYELGRELNLDNPRTYNEKLQWLKLYDRNPNYTIMADKYRVRQYIADTLGSEYLIPLIGVWEKTDDIDFSKLPSKFVLKCNHNSGRGLCVCTDKTRIDEKKVKKALKKGIKEDYFLLNREWVYKNIPRCIVGEEYIEDSSNVNGGLIDYKFYCFNGSPKFLYVSSANIVNGKKHDKLTYLDLNFNRTKFYRPDHEELNIEISKPQNFDKMLTICETLSANIPFVRIDLYNVKGKIYFSEMTFCPGAGFSQFSPDEWNTILGEWITLPEKTVE